ncbi:MAG: c-type cytochrome [Candidatus Mycalebacterium zealandia]|nr:MAG: c-type cytochrome [Candidatus Mycalebacterium zealandia]
MRFVILAVFFAAPFLFPGDCAANEGEALFVERDCVRCHTIGRGRFAGPDLKGVFDRYSKDEVVLWITDSSAVYEARGGAPVNEGYPPMPPTNVSEREAEKIADYLFSLHDVASDAPDGGALFGKVVNKTTGKPAADVKVLLSSFIAERLISERSETSGAQGVFRFEGLSWSASHKISIQKDGVLYETDKMVFAPRQSEIKTTLPIYETITDDRAIGLELAHMIVEPFEGGIRVAEFVEFANRGKTAVVADNDDKNSATLRFGVPEGTENLNFIHGADSSSVSARTGAFVLPVLPGLKKIVFSYLVPFQNSGKTVFTKTLEYKTSSFVAISSDLQGVEVAGLGEAKHVSGEDGRVFLRWESKRIAKGAKIKISVKSPSPDKPAWLLPVMVFALVLAFAVLFRRARQTN